MVCLAPSLCTAQRSPQAAFAASLSRATAHRERLLTCSDEWLRKHAVMVRPFGYCVLDVFALFETERVPVEVIVVAGELDEHVASPQVVALLLSRVVAVVRGSPHLPPGRATATLARELQAQCRTLANGSAPEAPLRPLHGCLLIPEATRNGGLSVCVVRDMPPRRPMSKDLTEQSAWDGRFRVTPVHAGAEGSPPLRPGSLNPVDDAPALLAAARAAGLLPSRSGTKRAKKQAKHFLRHGLAPHLWRLGLPVFHDEQLPPPHFPLLPNSGGRPVAVARFDPPSLEQSPWGW
jgi:hypothetical protein